MQGCKIKITLVFILLIQQFHATTQNDSIVERILKEKNDSVKVKLLNDRVWDLMFTDKTGSLGIAEKALAIALKSNNFNSLSDCYNTLGSYYIITSDFNKSVSYHQKALEIRTKLNDRKGLMKTYNNLGSAYKYLGFHQKEIDYYFLALKLAEEFKDTLVQTSIMNNIGDAFGRQENYDKAIEYNTRALALREKLNDLKGICSSMINLGTMYYRKKDFKQSESYFLRTEKILPSLDDKYIKALFHSNFAPLLKDLKRYDEAREHIKTSILLHETIGNKNGNLVNYINIGSIFEEKNNIVEANDAYRKALDLSLSVGNLLWQQQSYLGLARTFSRLNRFDEAYTNQLLGEKLGDSLSKLAIRTKMEELEQKYNNEKLENENQLLQKKNVIQELESEQRGYVITFLTILFVTAALIVMLFWRNYRFKQQLKLKQIAVQAEENERQRIAKDIHDELGSGLTKIRFMSELLKNQSKNSPEAIGTISETSNSLVENMRDLIWVMNPDNATLDNLVARIREYTGQYIEEFNIDLEFISPPVIPSQKISKEINRNVFMVVKEAMQNLVKHSSATKTIIRIIIGDELKIEIEDNGKGNASEKKEGNGLRNMRSRIEQLQGRFHISSEENKGTVVTMTVPL